jgi:tight adherence protein B
MKAGWIVLVALTIAAIGRGGSRWWRSTTVGRRFDPGSADRGDRSEWRRVAADLLARLAAGRPRPWARRPHLADDVAPTLDELARSMAAGSTLAVAIGDLGPPTPSRPFAALIAGALVDHQLGRPLADAVAGTAGRIPSQASRRRPPSEPESTLALTVLEVVARHGGSAATTLHRSASAVRERRAVVAERAAQSAQARLSAQVLTVLPMGFAVWTAATDHRVGRFLFGSLLGAACLGLGLGINLVGWVWMRRIIRGRK